MFYPPCCFCHLKGTETDMFLPVPGDDNDIVTKSYIICFRLSTRFFVVFLWKFLRFSNEKQKKEMFCAMWKP